MHRNWLLLVVVIATGVSSCSDDGLCGDEAGESRIEIDAAALARPGSRLEICINDLCNEPSATNVSVNYGQGEHPSFAVYGVDRVTGTDWESIVGDRIDLSCDRGSSSIRIEIDADGKATVTGSSLLSP